MQPARDPAPALRVLIVDDEKLIRWALGQTLSDRGCLVAEAADGQAARGALRAGVFDVVVLDHRLPDTKELDLLRDIRAIAPAARVVMMTAFSTPQMIEDAMDLGVRCVLEKPIDIDAAAAIFAR